MNKFKRMKAQVVIPTDEMLKILNETQNDKVGIIQVKLDILNEKVNEIERKMLLLLSQVKELEKD